MNQKQCNISDSFDLQTGGGTGWCGLGMPSSTTPKSIKPIKTTVIKKLN